MLVHAVLVVKISSVVTGNAVGDASAGAGGSGSASGDFCEVLLVLVVIVLVVPVLLDSVCYSSIVSSPVLMEEVHKYAFRTGLCNPIYSPPHNISALSHEDVSH